MINGMDFDPFWSDIGHRLNLLGLKINVIRFCTLSGTRVWN